MRFWTYKRRRICVKLVAIFSALHIIYAILLITDNTSDSDNVSGKEKTPSALVKLLKQHGTTKICENLEPPSHDLKDAQRFLEVTPGGSYVFSAFYDKRTAVAVVRAVAIARMSVLWGSPHPNYCRLWVRGQKHPEIIPLSYIAIKEDHEKKFAAFLYECPLSYKSRIPFAISFTRGKCQTPVDNVFPVQKSFGKHDLVVEFSVCVPPLHSGFNNALKLIEFVETSRLFGGDRFVFYNYSIGPEVDRILRHYEHIRLADVVQWQLPTVKGYLGSSPVDAHYNGQLAAINDCLYRNLFRTDYIAFLDLDEIIVPRRFKAWSQIIQYTKGNSKLRDGQFCAFIFQNVFFRPDWTLDAKFKHNKTIQTLQLNTLLATRREYNILPHGYRSKYILDTRHADMAGIHFPWSCLNVAHDEMADHLINVDKKHGLLHHYRAWGDSLAQEGQGVYDAAMHKYATDIINKVSLRYLKMTEEDKSLKVPP